METAAYELLRSEIAAGLLSPNERLVERDVGDRFGLTRLEVHSALIRLEHDRLVVREPKRGARVRLVDQLEAVEILEARAALESIGARQAALRASELEVAELQAIAEEMRALRAREDLIAFSERNALLHSRIIEVSGHGTVQRLTAALTPQLVRFQWRTILQPGRPQQSLTEHGEIVAAIAARDGGRAEQAMRMHLENVTQALRDVAGHNVPV